MRPVRHAPILLALCALISSGALAAQTVLITGANSGIGLEFAREYAARGWTVIATHRRPDTPASLAALQQKYGPKLRIEHLDVTQEAEARALARKLANVPIDVLINNAGVYNDRHGCKPEDESCPGDWSNQRFGQLRFALLDSIMAVNVKGPLIVTEALYANVRASRMKKIVAVSSSNGSLTGPTGPPPGAIFYRSSKAALNRAMQLVASAVKADGVTVLVLNPGPTLTERQSYLSKYPGMLDTAFTVGNMIHTIDGASLKESGRFLRYDGAPEPW